LSCSIFTSLLKMQWNVKLESNWLSKAYEGISREQPHSENASQH
jgi:hypothetical protein